MRRSITLLLSCVSFFGLSLSARAADLMPAKAPQKAQSFFNGYPQGDGFYFGVNTALATGKANGVDLTTLNANAGTLVTQQGEVGLTFGYTWAAVGKPVWFAVEGTFDFSNITAQNPGVLNGGNLSLGGPADFEQVAIMGAPWAAVTSFLPSLNLQFPTLPALPTGITSGTPNLYLFAGAYEQDVSANFGLASGKQWLVGLTTGVGARALLSNSAALDGRIEYRSPTQSECINGFQVVAGCAGLGAQYMARTALLF
jgi:hypothetical protein